MTPELELLKLCVRMSALLHDWGKASVLFKDKLCAKKPEADAIRHEIVSCFAFDHLTEKKADVDWLSAILGDDLPNWLDKALTTGLSMLKTRLERLRSGKQGFAKEPFAYAPDTLVRQSIWWLIATHHRLLSADDLHSYNYQNHHNQLSTTNLKKLAQPKGPMLAVSSHREWVTAVRDCASEILDFLRSDRFAAIRYDPMIGLAGMFSYGRVALILGDHAGSAAPNYDTTSYPDAKSSKTGEPRVSVPQHNLDVHGASVRCFDGFVTAPVLAQRLQVIPDSVLAQTGNIDRFLWQNASIKMIQASAIKPEAGFFGVVLAGTGRGKTIACAKIVAALDEHPRFTVCLPLRSLTLQTGSAYCDDIGFSGMNVCIKIGSPVITSIYDFNKRDNDKARELDANSQTLEDNGKVPDEEPKTTAWVIPPEPNAVPPLTGLLAEFVERSREADHADLTRFLTCPILIATIDSLMGVSAGFKTSQMEQALRLLTSDLVIDEIDSFGERDQAAIIRLIYVAGTYGRRVLIASATVPAATAEACYRAYAAGYREYAMLTGKPFEIACGWFPDEAALVKVESNIVTQSFAELHQTAVSGVVEMMVQRDPLRRAELLAVSHCANEIDLFATVWEGCQQQHNRFNVRAPNGSRVSIGFVRWSNIAITREFARYLSAQNSVANTLHKIICYHSRHMLCIRNEIEVFLDNACNRKGGEGYSRLMNDPHVMAAIAEADGRDLMIIVVCSPILEIGRDFDFDWNIVDPSGLRMLVQADGRLGRHSTTHGCITGLILEEPSRALQQRWKGKGNKAAYIYPGVEDDTTDPRDKWRLRDRAGKFASNIIDVFDLATLRQAVDARDCLIQPARVNNEIGWMEHERLKHELIDYKMSVCAWSEGDPIGRMTNRHQTLCRFRANTMGALYVWRTRPGPSEAWKRNFDDGKAEVAEVVPAEQGSAFLLPLDSEQSFLKLVAIYKSLSQTAFKDLCGFEFQTYSANGIHVIEYSDQLGGGQAS